MNPEKQKENLEFLAAMVAKQIEESDDPEFIKAQISELFFDIERELGVTIESDVSDLYKEMKKENCLARIDSLSRVLKTLEFDEPMPIGSEEETDDHYANAVIPENEGIQLAFAEGQAPGPVRMLVGFGKTLIGFKTDHLEVKEINFNEDDPRDVAQRAYLCRHVSGELKKDDIKYVVMRIPKHMMPDNMVTDLEKDNIDKIKFLFRGFRI